jgi:hypothetical protein
VGLAVGLICVTEDTLGALDVTFDDVRVAVH